MHEDGEVQLKINLYLCSSGFLSLTTWKVVLPKLLNEILYLTRLQNCCKEIAITHIGMNVKINFVVLTL